ncbi:MAG: hypothetical protein WCK17_02205, partial [Verrucomicrobiota bacterium]
SADKIVKDLTNVITACSQQQISDLKKFETISASREQSADKIVKDLTNVITACSQQQISDLKKFETISASREQSADKIVKDLTNVITACSQQQISDLKKFETISASIDHLEKSIKSENIKNNAIWQVPQGNFKNFEEVIASNDHWPKTEEAIKTQFAQLTSNVVNLNALQKIGATDDIERITWSLNVFKFLAMSEDDPARTITYWQSLLENSPSGASKTLLDSLQSKKPNSEYFAKKLIKESEELLAVIPIPLEDLNNLNKGFDSLFEDFGDLDKNTTEIINKIQKQVKLKFIENEIDSKCKDVSNQFVRSTSLNEQRRAYLLANLLNELNALQTQLVASHGLQESDQVNNLINRITKSSNDLNANILKNNDKQSLDDRVDYQKWALLKIEAYSKEIRKSGTTPKLVAAAFRDYLLPVNEAYLDRQVAELYLKLWQEGWAKMPDDTDRWNFTMRSLEVTKKTPDTFK